MGFLDLLRTPFRWLKPEYRLLQEPCVTDHGGYITIEAVVKTPDRRQAKITVHMPTSPETGTEERWTLQNHEQDRTLEIKILQDTPFRFQEWYKNGFQAQGSITSARDHFNRITSLYDSLLNLAAYRKRPLRSV